MEQTIYAPIGNKLKLRNQNVKRNSLSFEKGQKKTAMIYTVLSPMTHILSTVNKIKRTKQ